MDPLHRELIHQAADAARAGDRDKAFELLDQVLKEDETNTAAWMLMARLTNSKDEKRMALTNILQLEPDNQRARDMLARLDAEAKAGSPESDVIAGVSRKMFRYIVFGVGSFVIVMILAIIFIISSSSQRRAEQNRLATQQIVEQTQVFERATRTSEALTLVAFNATQTLFAQVSPTPTPTETLRGPTLPPTRTPTAEATPTATLAPLDIPGNLLTWGGRDLSGAGVFPIQVRPLNGMGTLTEIEAPVGLHPFRARNAPIIAYSRYRSTQNTFDVQLVDPNGQPIASPLDNASAIAGYLDSSTPTLSTDGSRLVFAGTPAASRQDQIYLVIIQGEPIDGANVIQLTQDGAHYTYPSISPDGTRVVAVRSNLTGENPGIDLVIIDIASRTMTPLTTNLLEMEETTPRWSPNGDLIAFAAKPAGERNHDLFLIAPGSPNGQFRLDPAASTDDEIHPVFSPDAQYLAFASNRDGGIYNIFVVNLISQQLFQFTSARNNTFPSSWFF